jgi:hypothetical protein
VSGVEWEKTRRELSPRIAQRGAAATEENLNRRQQRKRSGFRPAARPLALLPSLPSVHNLPGKTRSCLIVARSSRSQIPHPFVLFVFFHEKAMSSGPRADTIFSFGGSLNVRLPSALCLGLLVTRCMLGSVVGLQPSCRTRCVVASWQPVHCTNRSHPDGTSRASDQKMWIRRETLFASCRLELRRFLHAVFPVVRIVFGPGHP